MVKKSKKSTLAIHSEASFIEKEATRLLSSYIEDKRMAKTYFTDNDKTPNYDGFFEILRGKQSGIPKKQFIVQIKGTEHLKQLSKGLNKGKYKYSLDTKFLYYVKDKVTENPAIYFVVDVKTNNIFWIYLSDEKLMSLDFEGKKNITYYFSQEELCGDINNFLKNLNQIADKRNQNFLCMNSIEISEIQEALTYLNNLFDNDLKFIKDLMFPDLWRFGIAYSKIPQETFKIQIQDKIITSNNGSNSFSIYPQIKGILDTGIKHNNNILNNQNFFNNIDLTGNNTPKKYVNNVISQILEKFFNSHLIISISPENVIWEFLSNIIIKFKQYFGLSIKYDILEIEKAIKIILKYLLTILKNNNLSPSETSLKLLLIDIFKRKQNYIEYDLNIEPFSLILNQNCKNSFVKFYKTNISKITNFDEDSMLYNYLETNFLEYLLAIKRAKELNLKTIPPIKIDKSKFIANKENDICYNARILCKDWFYYLEQTYLQIYNEIFRDNSYLNSGIYKYKIVKTVKKDLIWDVVKYPSEQLIIEEDNNLSDYLKDINSIGTLSGFGLSNFIYNDNTLYNSMKCLLYQGIANKLQIQCKGINFDYSNNRIFEI